MSQTRGQAVTLLAVPNVSEGRDRAAIDSIGAAFAAGGARMLDRHADPDHHRSVFTLAAAPGALAPALISGAREVLARVDLRRQSGQHPRVGALDVTPVVYLSEADRGAACAEALVTGDRLGHELELPVLLYGALAGGRGRAQLRRGGPVALAQRIERGELTPDFGPRRLHETAGAVLLAARPPLVAFNVELAAPATLQRARSIAASIREGAEHGLDGVRAIGVWLEQPGVAQVSTNVENPLATSLAEVLAAVAGHAEVAAAELVGLAPRAALRGFPADVPWRGRIGAPRTIEDALAGSL